MFFSSSENEKRCILYELGEEKKKQGGRIQEQKNERENLPNVFTQ